MIDHKRTIIAKDWIQKLANGINPLDGSLVPDDDIVNNVHISRCLFYIAELLETISKPSKRKIKEYELEFYISPENLSKVNIVERTGIANFVREINKIIPSNMRPLKYNQILNWLLANGYLEEVEVDNLGKKKNPTATGRAIGITAEMKNGMNGPYWAVEYNHNAQCFILNHIHLIAES